ncbi:MAG: site-specific DNA-methyltransferase [Terrimicrobiaceae bacterium]|nr:site-specific DNA-methyltransferase [Terrimicrobiaceae bacterium]
MIPQPYKPLPYTISPARGQALLSFEGRRMPDHLPLFEVTPVEQVGKPGKEPNLLIHGDCLSACAYLKANNIKVDLVYIDPPFASGANYAKKIFLRNGGKGALEGGNPIGEEIMYGDIWQKEDYLNWLYERLLAIREVVSESGAIYVHLDWHIGHYAKVLMDEVFGEDNFLNEIVWHYPGREMHLGNKFNSKHDMIFLYAKSVENFRLRTEAVALPYDKEERLETLRRKVHADPDGREWVWETRGQAAGEQPYKRYVDDIISQGQALNDVWTDLPFLRGNDPQRTGYPTQKPSWLLERLIKAGSDEGMIVADFFGGSGTTADVSHTLKRRFIVTDIGTYGIQTTRDRLAAAGASFDVLKIQDGIRLFRNPAQTVAKLFSLVEGFKKREELELGEFWDGGLPGASGRYIPLKFVGLQERLTPALLDVCLEEIYQLESDDRAEGVRILYAHRDLAVDQACVNKRLKASGKTQLKVELVSLNELLDRKAASLFTPDSAVLDVKPGKKAELAVTVKQYFSPYLKAKIDEFNAKRGKKNGGELIEANGNGNREENGNGESNGNGEEAAKPSVPFKPVTISETGLELIEAVQFDTTLRKDDVWVSNPALEDKAGPKEKIKGSYTVPAKAFKIKFRNIAGDEIILDYPPAKA